MFSCSALIAWLAILTPLAAAQEPPWWDYQGAVFGSDTVSGDDFGKSVSLSGNELAVSAYRADHAGKMEAGAVYIFAKSGANWVEQARLTANDAHSWDQFGFSVSMSGDTLAVGSFAGNAGYVCQRNGASWLEVAKLVSADLMPGDGFGREVALSGDTVVIGASFDEHTPGQAGGFGEGSAYVFVRSGSVWQEQARLTASDAENNDWFGHYVAISGDTIVVGSAFDDHAPGANGSWNNGQGSAYVFVRSGTTWTQQAKLTASDAQPEDRFGGGVAIDGDTAVIGAHNDNHAPGVPGNPGEGSAYVFVRSGTTWTEAGKLAADDAQNGDSFGRMLAIEQSTLVISSIFDGAGAGKLNAGAAYIFGRAGGVWGETHKVVAEVREASGQFGSGVAVGYPYAAFGGPGQGTGGLAYIYEGTDSCTGCTSYCTSGTSSNGCSALIWAYGDPSASASDGFLVVGSQTGNNSGLFFFGPNGRQANPWGNGTSYQCVIPPVKRAGLLVGSGKPKLCKGTFTLDLNTLWAQQPLKNPGSGAVVQAQLWVRDPNNTSNAKTVMSDAIELTVGP